MIALVQRVLLAEKIYGKSLDRRLEEFGWEIMSQIEEMDIEGLDLDVVDKDWVLATVEGRDEVAVANLLRLRYGEVKSMEEVSEGEELRGFITDLGRVGYGVYVDAFVEDKDALVPLYELRRSLVGGKKLPARLIARLFGFVERMPLRIVVERKRDGAVDASIAPRQAAEFQRWIRRGLDVLVVSGYTAREIRRALRKSRHAVDVIRIERLAFLCHALVCKADTQARGLVPAVGPHLPGAPLGVFSPREIRRTISQAEGSQEEVE